MSTNYSNIRRNIVDRNASRRGSFARFQLLKDVSSNRYLRIEVPLPLKQVGAFRRTVAKVFTGDERGTWGDFVSGQKISQLSYQLSFICCVFTYFLAQYLFFQKPGALPKFYVFGFLALYVFRVDSFLRTQRKFYIMDYCYMVSFVSILALTVFQESWLWKAAFSLASGIPALTAYTLPKYNAITISSTYSMYHLTNLFLHYLPAVALTVYRDERMKVDPTFLSSSEKLNSDLYGYFLIPTALIATWLSFYVVLTEIFCYKQIYSETSEEVQREGTTFKYLFSYYKSRKNFSGYRRTCEFIFHFLRIIPKEIDFSPDNNSEETRYHHFFAVVAFFFMLLSGPVILQPVAFVLSKDKVLLNAFLATNLLKLVYNGAVESFPESYPDESTEVKSVSEAKIDPLKDLLDDDISSTDSDAEGDIRTVDLTNLTRMPKKDLPAYNPVVETLKQQDSLMSNSSGITKDL
eukprot:maker-scaffold_7-snap-gene-9.9-mRNA-1 protein AED:0.00 eAED:0.00 QI:93/1/1/1/0/0/2/27/462